MPSPICPTCCLDGDVVVDGGSGWLCLAHDPPLAVAELVWVSPGRMARAYHRNSTCTMMSRGREWAADYSADGVPGELVQVDITEAIAKGRRPCRECGRASD